MEPTYSDESFLELAAKLAKRFKVRYGRSVHLTGKYRANNRDFKSDKVVYICRDRNTGRLLKVGQSTNWMGRCAHYSYKDRHCDIVVDLFVAQSWDHQDQTEKDFRKYLEDLGCELPWDNTSMRLSKRQAVACQ